MAWLAEYLRAARLVTKDADAFVREFSLQRGELAVNVHAYAWPAHEAFLRTYYADDRPRIVSLSMNPARNGAVQSGIAFTDAPTARLLLPDFDRIVNRPPNLRTERVEMSGQKLRSWADLRLGGLKALYSRVLFPIACPVAILEGPNLVNVPLASLTGRRRALADAFYGTHAPLLVRAARPRGVLLLGSYAAQRWGALARANPDLAALPAVETHHPAARMANAQKFNDWSRALRSLSRPRGTRAA